MRRGGAQLALLLLQLAVSAAEWNLTWRQVGVDTPLAVGNAVAQRATTYRSSAFWLDPGRVVLTPPNETPIPVPAGPFVLRGLRVEVVDAGGRPVPLTEVYLHHVAFYDGVRSADLCGGAALQGRDALWSVGAESRHTETFFPNGYGIMYGVAGSEEPRWSANIHIIRTQDVAHIKHCIECHCTSPVDEAGGGSEDCCPDGSLCGGAVAETSPRSRRKPYHLQYTVWHDDPAGVAGSHRELRYHTLDAGACQLEWQVPALCAWRFRHAGTAAGSGQLPGVAGLRGSGRYFPFDFLLPEEEDLPPHCISTMRWSTTRAYDGSLVFGKGHLHIGGIDLSLYRELPGRQKGRELLCRNSALYGTGAGASSSGQLWEQPAGNELGYVVGITGCDPPLANSTASSPITLRKGDRLTVEARYRAAPWFEGVMGLLDIAVAPLAPPATAAAIE